MDRQSAMQTYSFVDLPALVSGLRNTHALYNLLKTLSSGLDKDYRIFYMQ